MVGCSGRIRDPEFQSQGLENLQGLSDLTGWLPLLKVNNETKACTAGHRQIFLGNFQLSAPCADRDAELLWGSSIHIAGWSIPPRGMRVKGNITDRERIRIRKPFELEYYRPGTFVIPSTPGESRIPGRGSARGEEGADGAFAGFDDFAETELDAGAV